MAPQTRGLLFLLIIYINGTAIVIARDCRQLKGKVK